MNPTDNRPEVPSAAPITPYLKHHLQVHPSMTPQDIAKLCYQAAHGAEHLLADMDRARLYLARELDATPSDADMPLVEPISEAVARVNLAPWKAKGLTPDTLFELFAATARVSGQGDQRLDAYLKEVSVYLNGESAPISPAEWQEFLTRYDGEGRPAIHHSASYREAEHPAYRIVMRSILRDVGLE